MNNILTNILGNPIVNKWKTKQAENFLLWNTRYNFENLDEKNNKNLLFSMHNWACYNKDNLQGLKMKKKLKTRVGKVWIDTRTFLGQWPAF